MTDVPFHLTRLGRAFFERDVPELVKQLTRLNENIEALSEAFANIGIVANGDPEEPDHEPENEP